MLVKQGGVVLVQFFDYESDESFPYPTAAVGDLVLPQVALYHAFLLLIGKECEPLLSD